MTKRKSDNNKNNKESKGLYIQLYNIHGLIRGHDLELGRDADTGGQTKYVLELAKGLSKRDDVEKVEIVTRWIEDKRVSPDYYKKDEKINDKLHIIRIRCGGKKYIRKELLWDSLEEFVDRSIKYIKSQGRLPDIIHSHYADAGYVCTELTKFFGIKLIHTGHSLGKSKLQNLLSSGVKEEDIEKRYNIGKRIEAEENVIFYADRIITSTNQEIDKQYGQYENTVKDKFAVIPPGIDLDRFFPYTDEIEWDRETQEIRSSIRNEQWKFFQQINKPLILTLCRPEKRKNIGGLIDAYGTDKELQEMANLAIFAGIRRDIQKMPEIEQDVLTEMLLLMDKYDLYGKMAIPKRHDFEHEVPELYRIAAETGGVFVNSAYAEPFGLTLIEGGSSGLPIVSTDDGGPRDIVNNLKNGILVDITDSRNIANAIKRILNDRGLWKEYSENGIKNTPKYYSWDAHTETYIRIINQLLTEGIEKKATTFSSTGKKLLNVDKLMFVDIDDTLLGDEEALERFKEFLEKSKGTIGFGVVSGRTIESIKKVLSKNDIPLPDIAISSVGAEIYYQDSSENIYSTGWDSHISYAWNRQKIKNALSDFEFLQFQEEETQRKFKVSYYVNDADEDKLARVKDTLVKNKIRCNTIFSHRQYLDILPYRASKGRAIKYLAYRWNIPMENVLTAGDSGNDEDMLRGEILGVVVGNHSEELEKLKGKRRIYFARNTHANGILEGIKHYDFLKKRGDNE